MPDNNSFCLTAARSIQEMARKAATMNPSEMPITLDPNDYQPYLAGKLAVVAILTSGISKESLANQVEHYQILREDSAEKRMAEQPFAQFEDDFPELATNPFCGTVSDDTIRVLSQILYSTTPGPLAAGMRDAARHIIEMLGLPAQHQAV